MEMVTKTVNATINRHMANKHQSGIQYDWIFDDNVGGLYIGYSYIKPYDYYGVYVLQFTTHSFYGVSTNIKISISIYQADHYGDIVDIPIRYAICKSDSNKDMYRHTSSSVSDENQLVSGVFTIPSVSSTSEWHEIMINTPKIEPNTTYYLFLWAASDSHDTVNRFLNYTPWMTNEHIVIEYYEHMTHIDTGSEIKPCQCYIDNGESWIPVVPYIDNGSSWDICV